MTDRFQAARRVADAVLHEGQVLYPYRASSSKNRVRFQFGVLAPEAYCRNDPSEVSSLRSEWLLEGREPRVQVAVRCLHLCSREVVAVDPVRGTESDVAELEVAGRLFTSFDESIEHEVELCDLPLAEITRGLETTFELASSEDVEDLRDARGRLAGRLHRIVAPATGRAGVRATSIGGPYGLTRLSVVVENVTPWEGLGSGREVLLRRCLVAVHILGAVSGGRFLSVIDPPEFARSATASCHSSGSFPVLASDADDVVLSSPIILYDHPGVAPESVGEFCDATEMDEMLALRVLTLTEAEKAEARATDPRSGQLVELCDTMPDELFARLHGAIRSLRPVGTEATQPIVPWWDPGSDCEVDPTRDSVAVSGGLARKGVSVRLHPSRRADAQDIFLAERSATVTGVFRDVDGAVHVAVVLDDDESADLHTWHGRYLYFHPDEVEAIDPEPAREAR